MVEDTAASLGSGISGAVDWDAGNTRFRLHINGDLITGNLSEATIDASGDLTLRANNGGREEPGYPIALSGSQTPTTVIYRSSVNATGGAEDNRVTFDLASKWWNINEQSFQILEFVESVL